MSDQDYRDAVLLERRQVGTDPLWQRAEVARCFAQTTTDPTAGFIYWASRYWTLTDKTSRIVLLRPNPIQWQFLQDRTRENVIVKARKEGLSTIIDALYYWRCRARSFQHAYIMAHVADSTAELWDRIRRAHESMPAFITGPTERSSRRELVFADNGSHLRLLTAGGKESGRAGDMSCGHFSEAAHYPDLGKVLAAAGEAAISDAWLDFESTPQGFDRFRQIYKEARDGETGRTAHFFTWWEDPGNRLACPGGWPDLGDLSKDETRLVRLYGLDAEQVAWRREKKKRLGPLFNQEHPEDDETCFLVGGTPKFDNELLRDLLQVVEKRVRPIHPEARLHGLCQPGLTVWVEPQKGHRYVIGADVAEGLPGCAYSVAAVLDLSTDPPEQVAEWHGHANPTDFGKRILVNLGYWYNQALVGPEINNHGHTTIAALRGSGYYPIYRHRYYDQRSGETRRFKLGWPTDGKTRPEMFDDLRECFTIGGMVIRSRAFLAECIAMQAGDEAGEEDAAGTSGNWRDRIFAWAIAWQLRKKGVPTVVS
jgi:hypothetical protein